MSGLSNKSDLAAAALAAAARIDAAANARFEGTIEDAQLFRALAATLSESDHSKAAVDVLAERRRQVEEEGWTPEHDDQHDAGEIAGAAASYAAYRSHTKPETIMGYDVIEMLWPWARKWWKPKDRRRDLVRAGALIIAEIERLDRDAEREASHA